MLGLNFMSSTMNARFGIETTPPIRIFSFNQSQIIEFGIYYDLFLRRIDELKENPPENDWQGVFVADFK